MTKTTTVQASTVEEATAMALEQLNTTKEKAKIEVLSNGGLFDKAEVKVTVEDQALELVTEFANGIIEKMGLNLKANITEKGNDISVIIEGKDSAAVIGFRGEVLDSFQYILLSYLNQNNYDYKKLSIDCEGYRSRREKTLGQLALKMADKAYAMGREVEFEPMNPFERRAIHTALQESTLVKTQSEGEEPNRYVVLIPNTDITGPRFKARGEDYNRHDKKNNQNRNRSNRKQNDSEKEVADGKVFRGTFADIEPSTTPTNGAPKFKSFGQKKF